MPYVGWKIFAYQYLEDPAQREPVSKLLLLMKVQANDFTINYEDGPRTETYLLVMESECLAWKQTELKHKKLMEQVSRRLPWRKVNCYVEDGEQLSLVYSSNIEPEPPFSVTPTTRSECPIPERLPPQSKPVRPRIVKPHPKQPRRRRGPNALKDLIAKVKKEKNQKRV